jgi:hypothetical protein
VTKFWKAVAYVWSHIELIQRINLLSSHKKTIIAYTTVRSDAVRAATPVKMITTLPKREPVPPDDDCHAPRTSSAMTAEIGDALRRRSWPKDQEQKMMIQLLSVLTGHPFSKDVSGDLGLVLYYEIGKELGPDLISGSAFSTSNAGSICPSPNYATLYNSRFLYILRFLEQLSIATLKSIVNISPLLRAMTFSCTIACICPEYGINCHGAANDWHYRSLQLAATH